MSILEFPNLPAGLRLDTSFAVYHAVIDSRELQGASPLSESQWMFGHTRKRRSVVVSISTRIEVPETDIIATNLQVFEGCVSICRNIAFWAGELWIAETSQINLSRRSGALFWPIETFRTRTTNDTFVALNLNNKLSKPWFILFRGD